jgi:hypothetical protein
MSEDARPAGVFILIVGLIRSPPDPSRRCAIEQHGNCAKPHVSREETRSNFVVFGEQFQYIYAFSKIAE